MLAVKSRMPDMAMAAINPRTPARTVDAASGTVHLRPRDVTRGATQFLTHTPSHPPSPAKTLR
ncbi:hypothetical protein Airi02_011880 [Actinoallomurus iriomotensis]|uniref:Uncharacterized protein n=1 Tax=Actinoallomurus iriomotensis TaxID=478107 RepID=A0A9W6VSE4_9ACTN|nr:hypothetical protein Airi02_011880 [Actinoallomurus iriomotensis]